METETSIHYLVPLFLSALLTTGAALAQPHGQVLAWGWNLFELPRETLK